MESLTGEGGGSRLAGDFGAGCTTVGLIARASLATQVHDKGRPVTRSRKIESWQPPQACRGQSSMKCSVEVWHRWRGGARVSVRFSLKSRIVEVFFYRGFAPCHSRCGDLLHPISNSQFNSRYSWDSEESLLGEKNSCLLRVGVQNDPHWWRAGHRVNPMGSGRVQQMRTGRVSLGGTGAN
jgi:hypothetical protein